MPQEEEAARPPSEKLLTTLRPLPVSSRASTGSAGEGGAAHATPTNVNTRRMGQLTLV